MTQSLRDTNGIGLDILRTPPDEIIPPPPIPRPTYEYPRHPDAVVLRIYETLADINKAGLGKWAKPDCHCDGPFELLVRIQDNGILLYKLRCRGCGRSIGGAIGHDNIPPDVRVRKGDEIPEPSQFANEEWHERDRYHHKISLAARNVDSR
jgi:hypothetical protein